MAVMQSKTFKEHPLGVQLAVEHFANSSDFTKYVQLNKIYNFKYVFLNVIQNNWDFIKGFHGKNIKYNSQQISKRVHTA